MTNKIQSIDFLHDQIITSRTTSPGKYSRSVSINQTDGNFVVTYPLNNSLAIYPQSPNTTMGRVPLSVVTDLGNFGTLSYPSDAKFDSVRGNIWVADMGNNRILSLNYASRLIDFEFKGVTFPYILCVNSNNGDVYARGFSDLNTGTIHIFSRNGEIKHTISFAESFPAEEFKIKSIPYIPNDLGGCGSMKFDHVRNRLWWVAGNVLHMADLINNEIFTNDLFSRYELDNVRGLEIDFSNGNVFIGGRPQRFEDGSLTKYSILLNIYKDNNFLLRQTFVSDSVWGEI